MSEKLYELYCQTCNFKQITNGANITLVPHQYSTVQRTLPELDEAGKVKEIKWKEPPKRFKCPKCGYIIKPKIIENQQAKINEEVRLQEKIKKRQEYEKEQERKEREKQNEDWANRNQTSLE